MADLNLLTEDVISLTEARNFCQRLEARSVRTSVPFGDGRFGVSVE